MLRRPKPAASVHTSFLLNVIGSVMFALLINAVVFAFGWDTAVSKHASRLQPPGYVVGAVWVTLFASMGYARYLIVRSRAADARRDARVIVALIVGCAIYPLYTIGLSSVAIGLAGNIATLAATLGVTGIVLREHRRAAAFLVPVAAWLSFATYLTAATLLSS